MTLSTGGLSSEILAVSLLSLPSLHGKNFPSTAAAAHSCTAAIAGPIVIAK